jgi:antagonist of KipI
MPIPVRSAGFETTVQDCGRFGYRKFGVATAGALDSAALRVLNLLVGNEECAAGLEIVSGRVRLQFTDKCLIAWSGGDFDVRTEAFAVPRLHCARVLAGALCEISPRRGRAWLAISGGIAVPEILGSRSTDLRARFGGFQGRALRDGDELVRGLPSAAAMRMAKEMAEPVADWSGPQFSSSRAKSRDPAEVALKLPQRDPSAALGMTLRIIPGKDWSNETGSKLLASTFRIAMNSDRMGLRLEGVFIASGDGSELISEPVAPGTIQLPRGGGPILLLADCQTVGGYPKLAHVITVDLAHAAQLQPMDEVQFELTTLESAQELLRKREHDIALFRAGLDARFR